MAKKKDEMGINIYENTESNPLENSVNIEEKIEVKQEIKYKYFLNKRNLLQLNIKDSPEQKYRGFYVSAGNFALTETQSELCLELKNLLAGGEVIALTTKPEKFQKPPKYIVSVAKPKKEKGKITRFEKKMV